MASESNVPAHIQATTNSSGGGCAQSEVMSTRREGRVGQLDEARSLSLEARWEAAEQGSAVRDGNIEPSVEKSSRSLERDSNLTKDRVRSINAHGVIDRATAQGRTVCRAGCTTCSSTRESGQSSMSSRKRGGSSRTGSQRAGKARYTTLAEHSVEADNQAQLSGSRLDPQLQRLYQVDTRENTEENYSRNDKNEVNSGKNRELTLVHYSEDSPDNSGMSGPMSEQHRSIQFLDNPDEPSNISAHTLTSDIVMTISSEVHETTSSTSTMVDDSDDSEQSQWSIDSTISEESDEATREENQAYIDTLLRERETLDTENRLMREALAYAKASMELLETAIRNDRLNQ